MDSYQFTIWILILPFVAFLVTGVLNGKLSPTISAGISIAAIALVTALSYFTAISYFFLNSAESYEAIQAASVTWLRLTDTLIIDMGIIIDPISAMMLVVISTVSLMVHIYSTGYMKGEDGYARYFTFLSLFSFAMLGLVLATNLMQIYIFWELVGVSSFLLIGYYYKKPTAIAAAKKAFIVTRFADLGFLIGILLLSYYTGTFNFMEITNPEGALISNPIAGTFMGFSVMTWALVLIFIGGAGKSAMFPFHVWLPDAMEGPTPVSALIHAATMVVAGVYLVGRMFSVYALAAPEALEVVAFIGAFTSLFAAVIAIVQTDIKKVLAYSTISQLGYMMLALGISGYGAEAGLGFTASMFHLFTHAFFKALLFLGAGSIIHAVHSNEMKDMGNLRKHLPSTHLTFLIATLAIAGIPPLSGFFSKDEILAAAWQANKLYFAVEYLVAGLTAFYMFRLYFRVFWGQERKYDHIHESPASMTVPLWILAIGAVFAGFLPFSHLVTSDGQPFDTHFHWSIALASVGIALIGILSANALYRKESDKSAKIRASLGGLYVLVDNKFYMDEFYLFVTKKIIFRYITSSAAWFDKHIVDGLMNLIGNVTMAISVRSRNFQSGNVHQYAMVFLTGLLLIVMVYFYFNPN
ncbi:MAG: NADH-quinone oxidoreductase subunit L [Cyclobacteriaceae bacterium]|nr:NADH-quinone oxidoreductase subunit L [Cyclobacteriaceae bacterium]